MNEKTEQIFNKYEDILLKNLEKYESGEKIDTEAIIALNDSMRIIHHINTMRRLGNKASIQDESIL